MNEMNGQKLVKWKKMLLLPQSLAVQFCEQYFQKHTLLLVFFVCGGCDFLEFRPGTTVSVLALDALSRDKGDVVVGFTTALSEAENNLFFFPECLPLARVMKVMRELSVLLIVRCTSSKAEIIFRICPRLSNAGFRSLLNPGVTLLAVVRSGVLVRNHCRKNSLDLSGPSEA